MPIWKAILIILGIAFLNTFLWFLPISSVMVKFNAFQLKTMQDAITLVVFVFLYLKEPLKGNNLVGFGFVFLAVWVDLKNKIQ